MLLRPTLPSAMGMELGMTLTTWRRDGSLAKDLSKMNGVSLVCIYRVRSFCLVQLKRT